MRFLSSSSPMVDMSIPSILVLGDRSTGHHKNDQIETNMIRPSVASSIRKSDIANVDLPVHFCHRNGETDKRNSYQNLFYQPRKLSTKNWVDIILTYHTNFFGWIDREGQFVKYGR